MSGAQLSPHFTLEELTRSDTALRLGIDNTPSEGQAENLRLLCLQVLEPLRLQMGVPVRIHSGYRSEALNRAVGGSATSAHMQGLAADITVPGRTPAEILAAIKDVIVFDQAIIEYDAWLHISLNPGGVNRKQCLRARAHKGRTRFEPWPRIGG